VRIAITQWPEALTAGSAQWREIVNLVAAARPDILLTNELPFGPWLAEVAAFSPEKARLSIEAHERGEQALAALNVPAVISSRPVWQGSRLANEAYVIERGVSLPLHRKQYFPNEPGWFEREWYAGDTSGFAAAEVLGIKVGMLVCTEAMFNEHARAYGKQGVSLIAIPRASGTEIDAWKVAGAMASLVSGVYVVSSNRVGRGAHGTVFGGGGFAYAPHGRFIAETNSRQPMQVFELDPNETRRAQQEYPCYVSEME
jgi:N-carbamoylputrescine amidase